MRSYSLVQLIAGVLLFFFTVCFSLAANPGKSNKNELVDIVYEWNEAGEIIQVGDYIINRIGPVYEDHGNGFLVESSKRKIFVGSLVKVFPVRGEEEGFWQTDRVIIYSGEGIQNILQTISEEKKEVLLATLASFNKINKTEEKKKPVSEQGEPHLENGVWVN